jgi:hypothetical protein
MRNNNKLTLKSLKEELENLKVKNSGSKGSKATSENITKGGIGHDIKDSYIQRLYMRSSGLSLYLITGLLAYAHKIPFKGRIISLASLWYGRTTIWKILVKVRKIFIVINALLGVFLVFKTAGFSTDNLLVGFVAVGESYFIMFKNITYKLFTWFVEFFDHKVIPNVPGDNGGTFFSKPLPPKAKSLFIPSNIPNLLEAESFSLRNLYKDAVYNPTPWYKDTTTWLWIIGGLGVLYVGYKLYADPLFISDLFNKNPKITNTAPTPPSQTGTGIISGTGVASGSDITLDDTRVGAGASGVSKVTKSIVAVYSSTIRKLNPVNWFATSNEINNQFKNFMEVQKDYVRAETHLYPFTEVNPFNSWFKRIRVNWLGETSSELAERLKLKELAYEMYNKIAVKNSTNIVEGSATITSGRISPSGWTPTASPLITNALGLHPFTPLNLPNIGVITTLDTLKSLPSTPTGIIEVLPDWSSHVKDTSQDAFE